MERERELVRCFNIELNRRDFLFHFAIQTVTFSSFANCFVPLDRSLRKGKIVFQHVLKGLLKNICELWAVNCEKKGEKNEKFNSNYVCYHFRHRNRSISMIWCSDFRKMLKNTFFDNFLVIFEKFSIFQSIIPS